MHRGSRLRDGRLHQGLLGNRAGPAQSHSGRLRGPTDFMDDRCLRAGRTSETAPYGPLQPRLGQRPAHRGVLAAPRLGTSIHRRRPDLRRLPAPIGRPSRAVARPGAAALPVGGRLSAKGVGGGPHEGGGKGPLRWRRPPRPPRTRRPGAHPHRRRDHPGPLRGDCADLLAQRPFYGTATPSRSSSSSSSWRTATIFPRSPPPPTSRAPSGRA